MCELFALNSRFPANVALSMSEFARHGGDTKPHKDGWGIAFFAGRDVRLIRDTDAAADSPCVDFLRHHQYRSRLVISHLRLATVGKVTLANTQPFGRELAGRMHLFAHNGDLPGIEALPSASRPRFQPIGETDSEIAFCRLLEQLTAIWDAPEPPSLADRHQVVRHFADEIALLGPANFIYADGEYLFAHGDKRSQSGREGYHPPGLHWLCRSCSAEQAHPQIDGITLSFSSQWQQVALIASVPLTDGPWKPFAGGELAVFRDGERVTP